MTIESWLALGAGLLLATGTVVQVLVNGRQAACRRRAAVGMRVAAAVLLAAAYTTAALSWGQWTPVEPRQAVLGLAVALLAVHLLLAWWLRADGAGPVVDLLALGLSLVAVSVRNGAPVLTWVHKASAVWMQWVFFLVGTGAAIVAGGSGLVLALNAALASRGRSFRLPRREDACISLKQATGFAWLALGSGLVVATWWSWRTTGSLAGGNLRELWMAVTWLVTAIGLLSWQLGRRAVWWAAVFVTVAAATAVIGLLATPDLLHMLGG